MEQMTNLSMSVENQALKKSTDSHMLKHKQLDV